MLLKYLRALFARFYSKNENGVIGHQAMINTGGRTSYSTSEFIAPYDCYITVICNSNDRSAACYLYVNSLPINGTRLFLDAANEFLVFACAKRGDRVLANIVAPGTLSEIAVFQTVGGGINRLFRCFGGACYA